jgi:hypothetical protein
MTHLKNRRDVLLQHNMPQMLCMSAGNVAFGARESESAWIARRARKWAPGERGGARGAQPQNLGAGGRGPLSTRRPPLLPDFFSHTALRPRLR